MKYKLIAVAVLLALVFVSFATIGLSGDTVEAKDKTKDASVEFSVTLFGDPDFDLFGDPDFGANAIAVRILTAANIGSSGLDGVRTSSPDFNVDSFFDLEYRLDDDTDGDGLSDQAVTVIVKADVRVKNSDVDFSAVIDRVRDAFAKDRVAEFRGHVTVLK